MLEKEHSNYSSRYKIGKKVLVDFCKKGKLENTYIRAVIFTNCKVRYSIYLSNSKTTIHNVDSCFVKDSKDVDFIEFETDNYS